MSSSRNETQLQSVRSFATSVRSMLSASAAVGAGTILAVLISGSTYALWADAGTIDAGTVESGSMMITTAENFNDAAFTNLLVGERVRQTFTVTNTGKSQAVLTGTATASSAFEVRLASGACGATALAGNSATVSATSLGTLAPGATQSYCLEVLVAASAQPGNSAPIVATITAGQN